MANECFNYLEIVGDVAVIREVFEGILDNGLLQTLCPVSQGDDDDRAELEEQNHRWGTTYEAEIDHVVELDGDTAAEAKIVCYFTTAWTPPVFAVRQFNLDNQTYIKSVELLYFEDAIVFCGMYDPKYGHRHYAELSSMAVEDIESVIPARLNKIMRVTETIREWEEEAEDFVE